MKHSTYYIKLLLLLNQFGLLIVIVCGTTYAINAQATRKPYYRDIIIPKELEHHPHELLTFIDEYNSLKKRANEFAVWGSKLTFFCLSCSGFFFVINWYFLKKLNRLID